tara:strand:- start:5852 stop:7015 length:1164 start_codon:yes stop_codon:yes gene_type:complete
LTAEPIWLPPASLRTTATSTLGGCLSVIPAQVVTHSRPTSHGDQAQALAINLGTQLAHGKIMHASDRRTLLPLAIVTGLMLAGVNGCMANGGQAHGQPGISDAVIAAPDATEAIASHLPGVHNIVTYREGLVCGGVPEGDQGFATLQAMGIQTIISVDGATPDLKRAAAHGMRYVHLPISYDSVSTERQTQLAQAITNLKGPIFVHCHHGKHRSGAGLGTALVRSGLMSVDEVTARMQASGTSPSYEGLWQAVRDAQPLSAEQLQADPDSFPSLTQVTGMVAIMSEIDQVIDLVKQAHEAGWKAPDDHPDLVAPKETARLHQLFRRLRDEPESLNHASEYQSMLGDSIAASKKLDDAVRNGNALQAEQSLSTLSQGCKTCHRSFRNK